MSGSIEDHWAVMGEFDKKHRVKILVDEWGTVAADDLWLSPCYKNDCVVIHFTWKKDMKAVNKLLPAIEAELAVSSPAALGKIIHYATKALASFL